MIRFIEEDYEEDIGDELFGEWENNPFCCANKLIGEFGYETFEKRQKPNVNKIAASLNEIIKNSKECFITAFLTVPQYTQLRFAFYKAGFKNMGHSVNPKTGNTVYMFVWTRPKKKPTARVRRR